MKSIFKYLLVIGIVGILFLNFYYTKKGDDSSAAILAELLVDSVPVKPVRYEYGLPVDSFIVHKGRIKNNQFLADLLMKYRIDYQEVDQLVANSRDVFDVRNIRSGNRYCILCENDSMQTVKYFIYEADPVNYIVFNIGEKNVYAGKNDIEITEQSAEGRIESSLYSTLEKKGIDPVLAVKLSEIYAWTIDFYHLQKGDYFKVIYDEKFVMGKSIGLGQVKAALFNHRHTDLYAFYFEQGDGGEYYDDESKSMRKAFLKAPLKFSRITSNFSMKRFHPVQKIYKAHLGTDYGAPHGTPILSVGDGEVQEATHKLFNGNYVKIRHNATYTTQYLHMSKIAKGIKAGRRVKQGEVIGYVGSTGLATGPHVCFRFWKNDKQVDPLREKFPTAEPVKKENLEEYRQLLRELKVRLDRIGKDSLYYST